MNEYDSLKALFESNQDKENAIKMANYMQNKFPFYGIPATLRKELTKPFISIAKKEKFIDWPFLKMCYEDEHREMQYFVNDYLLAMTKYLSYDDVNTLIHFAKVKQWWDSIDFLDKVFGSIGEKDSRMDDLMIQFSISNDIWLRRLAIDHQQTRKEKTNTELLEKIIIPNLNNTEFFINKAIGWSLRDYSKVNPTWVKDFIDRYHDQLSKLSVKEASKYL